MKRLLPLLLAALLLFSACEKRRGDPFSLTDTGIRNEKSGVCYVALDPAFEPSKLGTVLGYPKWSKREDLTLREIPNLAAFLGDDEWNVYVAEGTALPDFSRCEITALILCVEDAISVEDRRFTRENGAEVITAACAAWFGEAEGELPDTVADTARRVRLTATEYPNLYYSFWYYRYADGAGYFYDKMTHRAVPLDASLVAALSGA